MRMDEDAICARERMGKGTNPGRGSYSKAGIAGIC